MKLFRFTFVHGNYDVGQAVVMAETMDEAEQKLARACEVNPPQGYPTSRGRWLMSTVMRVDYNGMRDDPFEIDGDVAFTHGIDG
jgi:hypothetical protein